MTANTKRIVIWAAIAGVIAIGLAISFMPRAVMVDLVEVKPGPLVVTLDEEGETRVHDVYTLSAPVNGRVQRINWLVGDPVTANDCLSGIPAMAESRA